MLERMTFDTWLGMNSYMWMCETSWAVTENI